MLPGHHRIPVKLDQAKPNLGNCKASAALELRECCDVTPLPVVCLGVK